MGHIKRRAGSYTRHRRRVLRCEALETRWLLAITVDTLIDEADGSIVDGDISLRDALARAPVGETIDFDASLDGGIIVLRLGELPVTNAIAIDATALPNGLTVDASGNDPTPDRNNGDGSRIFIIDDGEDGIDSPVTIGGLTLTGGDVFRDGGAILTRETLSVTSSTISGNPAMNGGGIWAGDNVTITNSTISGNSTVGCSGGGIWASGNVSVTFSTISGNSAKYGGGIWSSGDVTVSNSTISENSATYGGGIRATSGNVTVTNSMISDNDGTGIRASREITLTGSTVSGSGLGISGDNAVTITNSSISGNDIGIIGGKAVTVSDSTISDNGMGIISSGGDVAVDNSTVSGNGYGIGSWNSRLCLKTPTGRRTAGTAG